MGADLVQEVAVVGDHDHRALVVLEQIAEPVDAADVEVVGRLVEQQDVGVVEQHLREQHPQLETAGQAGKRLVVLFDRNAEADEQLGRIGFHRIAARVAEKPFDIVGALLLLLGEFELAVEIFAFLMDLPEVLVAHVDHIENRNVFVIIVVLFQEPHAAVLVDRDRSGGGILLAGENLHESRFAGTVRADQAVTAAGIELDGDVLEQHLLPEPHRNIGCCDHFCCVNP